MNSGPKTNPMRTLALLGSLALLAACGGGGGGGGGGPAGPAGLTYAQPAPTYVIGYAIAPNTPTLASGAATGYAVAAGTLPTGLALDAVTGILSGTPLIGVAAAAVTIEASDASGSTQANLVIAVEQPKLRAAYVPTSDDDRLSVFVHDTANGSLRHGGWVYTGAGSGPTAVAVGPTGTNVFAALTGTDEVIAYLANPQSGELAAAGALPSGGTGPSALAVHPLGGYLYVANASGTVGMFSIAPLTAALTALAPAVIAAGTSPSDLQISADGRFVYVTNAGSDDVTVYSIAPATGLLTLVETQAAGDQPAAIALTDKDTDNYAFAVNTLDATVSAFIVDAATGELDPAPGSPFVLPLVGMDPLAVIVDPTSSWVYTANSSTDSLGQLAIQIDGSLLPVGVGAVPTGATPSALGMDPGGVFVYAVCRGDNEVRYYRTDGGVRGALDPAAAPFLVRTAASPRAIALAPGLTSPVFTTDAVYVANFGDDDLSQFGFVAATSTSLVPPTVSAGDGPNWVSVHPLLDFAYATNFTAAATHSVSAYAIGAGGELGVGTPTDVISASWSFHIDLAGRSGFLMSALAGVIPMSIDPGTGALTAGTLVAAGSNPRSGAIHPTGKFLYVVDPIDHTISMFAIDPETADLSPLTPATITTGINTAPVAVVVDPAGRFAYAAAQGANDGIVGFAIDRTTGVLSPMFSPLVAAGVDVFDLAIHPSGRLLFAANRGSNDISAFVINTNPGNLTEDGSLDSPGTFPVGGPPRSLLVSADGGALFVSIEQASGLLETYSINALGVPTLTDTDATGDSSRGIGLRSRVQ